MQLAPGSAGRNLSSVGAVLPPTHAAHLGFSPTEKVPCRDEKPCGFRPLLHAHYLSDINLGLGTFNLHFPFCSSYPSYQVFNVPTPTLPIRRPQHLIRRIVVGYGLADWSRVRLRLFIPSALYLFSGLQAAVMISLALDEAPLKISHATTGGRISINSIFLPLKEALGPNHFAAVGC